MSPFIEAEIKRNMQKYGTQAQREVNELSKELKRAARYSNHHHFNLRCSKARIIPNSLPTKSPSDTKQAHSAAAKVSRIFLQEKIKAAWRIRCSASSNARHIWEFLKESLEIEDFVKVERICGKTAEQTFQHYKARQRQKFKKLRKRTTMVEEVIPKPEWTVNLSNR